MTLTAVATAPEPKDRVSLLDGRLATVVRCEEGGLWVRFDGSVDSVFVLFADVTPVR